MARRKKRSRWVFGLVAWTLFLSPFVGVAGIYMAMLYGSEETVVVTVNKTERVAGPEVSYYLIYTSSETFANSDSLLYGKWNSSDLHGSLEEGSRYRVKVVGWRVPLLSWYRNVLEAEQLE